MASSPTTSNAPNATSTCNFSSQGSACGVPSPGQLYLFTFLATVLILFLVAAAIILRSTHLRRRQNYLRATGQIPAPVPRRKAAEVDPKLKPHIFDLYLAPHSSAYDCGHGIAVETEWESVMPFAATYISESPPSASKSLTPTEDIADSPAPTPQPSISVGQFSPGIQFLRPLIMRRPTTASSDASSSPVSERGCEQLKPVTPTPEEVQTGTDKSESVPRRARVAYVISMPVPPPELSSASRISEISISHNDVENDNHEHGDEEEVEEGLVPLVQLGIAEVEVAPSSDGAE